MCSPDDPVAVALAAALARGVDLDPEATAFIDATFGDPTPQGLAALLAAADHPDGDALEALLFTADARLEREIEPLLAGRVFDAAAKEALLETLAARAPRTVLFRFADGRGALALEATLPRLGRLLASLELDRALPGAVELALEGVRTASETIWAAARRSLRRLRIAWSDPVIAFACKRIADRGLAAPPEIETLAYLLGVIADDPQGAVDPCAALAARHALLRAALRRGRREEELRAGLPPEVWASRGLRVVAFEEAETLRRIESLACACREVYGRPLP